MRDIQAKIRQRFFPFLLFYNAKKIKTETQVKKYGLVFDKRVLHVGTFKSYPYGYAQFTGFDAQDILNIETLI